MNRAALLRHPVALAGVVFTTVTAAVFIALAVAMTIGLLTNPYAGLVVFVVLPAAFVLALALIPLGARLERRRLKRERKIESEWPVIDLGRARTRQVLMVVTVLTAVNVVIVLVAGYGSLTWMESPQFCGAVCHAPMHPQYATWQNAPHAKVRCVQCHIGEGAESFVHYKLNGIRQLFHVATARYPRPITGNADLRPAVETCGTCHTPDRNRTERLRVSHEYADDEANTETVTALAMQVGGPGQPAPGGTAIHWHADPAVRVEFVSSDDDRQQIPYVRVTDARGETREFVADDAPADAAARGPVRLMDCTDCHNAVGHGVAPSPERAVDRAIAAGLISRTLPFVRRESVRLLAAEYPAPAAAERAIDEGLRGFYRAQGAAVDAEALDRAVAAVRRIYARNVFPAMKVTFGVYPDNIGHTNSQGCFRCHDGAHSTKDGRQIPSDCETCHKEIALPAPQ